MFYDKIGERIGEPGEVRGEGDGGVPQARENTTRAFSGSWKRVLMEGE
jgi:hypothetical protein